MGQHTKIDWCDASWNPVTGCYHKCAYCYARRIANRFGVQKASTSGAEMKLHVLDEAVVTDGSKKEPYPFGFEPTLHRYRLEEPQQWKKPRNIFVCSMADLFGEWVPDSWMRDVIDACYAAPWHRYLFLTKNPERYDDAIEYLETDVKDSTVAEPPEMWFGATVTNDEQLERAYASGATWVSIEPMLTDLCVQEAFCAFYYTPGGEAETKRWQWVVIGAETGNRKDKVVPKREWVEKIVAECDKWGTPVFMKASLRDMMGDDFRQEYPWKE